MFVVISAKGQKPWVPDQGGLCRTFVELSSNFCRTFVELLSNFCQTFVEFLSGLVDFCGTFVKLLSTYACFGAEKGFHDFPPNNTTLMQ